MSQLADLLIKLGENVALRQEYDENPDAVMVRFGLNEDEKAALRSEDVERIRVAAGLPGGTRVLKTVNVAPPPPPR